MDKEWITWRHFKRLISSQPFFIWNTLENSRDDLDNDEASLHFWEEVSSQKENISYGEIFVRTYSIIDKWLRNELINNRGHLIINGDKEKQIQDTKAAMKGDKLIISPVFSFDDAIAAPFAFDPKTKTAIYIKYSSKTKINDMIAPYWDYSIISKNYQINKIVLFLPQNKYYKKGEIDLYAIDSIHTTKTAKEPFKLNRNGEPMDTKIIDFVKNPVLKKGVFPDFDESLIKIKNAKNIKEISENLIYKDMTQILDNPYRNEMLEKLNFKYSNWNGNIITKKMILDFYENNNDEIFSSQILDSIEKISKCILTDPESEIIEIVQLKNANKVIWYDFEGFSLPYAPLDNVGPNKQLVFQVSVIETLNNHETRLENLVIDPAKISNDDLFKIIEEVYSNGADAYVVYNKNYELPRMEEIITLLRLENDPRVKKAEEMLLEITEKTIDLMNIFKINSKNKLPPVLMHDQKAKGSIKNIEKHISANKIKLPRPIEEYKNLDIKNGGMAMEVAIQRSLGLIGDREWKLKIDQLKKYCENDVRAMIMVYDFVIYLLEQNEIN
ncbi:MAG: DUF2779 domain-containing protein [Mycoplasmatales bacterium]|nr:DUF2779 domain-containing protein [Mycoplasmatales bacterium]